MGKSEDLMKGIDRVGIFERMKDYKIWHLRPGQLMLAMTADVRRCRFMLPSPEILIRGHGDPSRDAISTCIASLEGMNLLPGDRQRCISNDTADAGFIEKRVTELSVIKICTYGRISL